MNNNHHHYIEVRLGRDVSPPSEPFAMQAATEGALRRCLVEDCEKDNPNARLIELPRQDLVHLTLSPDENYGPQKCANFTKYVVVDDGTECIKGSNFVFFQFPDKHLSKFAIAQRRSK